MNIQNLTNSKRITFRRGFKILKKTKHLKKSFPPNITLLGGHRGENSKRVDFVPPLTLNFGTDTSPN